MTPARARVRAPWLASQSTQAVFAALERGGFRGRAVGGAVRNTLLGLPVSDIDLATDARPEQVMRLCEAAGFKVIPTGLLHGTVTVIVRSQPFEITSLRQDVATDGRHAEVAFTGDWAADARRRDFTINALYCDADGAIFDPLGGVADLDPVRVRFIGEPKARIREDYLRILRFFRFTAVYTADGVLDGEGLAACTAEREGLKQISGERIQAELLRLLAAQHAGRVTVELVASGVWRALVDVEPRAGDLKRLIAIENRLGLAPDPVRRLAALAVAAPPDAGVLDRRLKLPAKDRIRLALIGALADRGLPGCEEGHLRRLAYAAGSAAFEDGVLVGWARSGKDDAAWFNAATLFQRFALPVFPVGGGDLVALGFERGPAVGSTLAWLEARWLAGGFEPGRDGLLAMARQRLGDAKS